MGRILQQEYGWHVPSIYLFLQFHTRISRKTNNLKTFLKQCQIRKFIGILAFALVSLAFNCQWQIFTVTLHVDCGGRQWIMAHNWTLLHQSDIYWYQPVILKVWKGDVKQLIVGMPFLEGSFFLRIPNLFLDYLHYSWYPIWHLYKKVYMLLFTQCKSTGIQVKWNHFLYNHFMYISIYVLNAIQVS